MLLDRNKFDSITFRIPTPEGTASIIIVEDSPGTIHRIFFSIGKAGTGVNAWAFALAEMVVSNLQHRKLVDIINELSGITSSRWMYSENGVPCRSGPEALYLALIQYRNIYKHNHKNVTYDEDYEPPRMRN